MSALARSDGALGDGAGLIAGEAIQAEFRQCDGQTASSGFVFAALMRLIRSERFAGVRVSTMWTGSIHLSRGQNARMPVYPWSRAP